MKRFFQLTALIAAFLLMSASAWSKNVFDHVHVAPNGQGDTLIFPAYGAYPDGLQTKLQVVNTKMNASAVAKVVIRSAKCSQELRDFFIFLSPTDVWEGILKWDNGPIIRSVDDSALVNVVNGAPQWATPGNPQQVGLITPSNAGDTNWEGYVEVFLVHVFPDPITAANDIPGISKTSIFNRFVGDGDVANPQPTEGGSPNAIYQIEGLGGPYVDILAGNMQVQNPLWGMTSALNAVALKGFYLESGVGLAETSFLDAAWSNRFEVEAALAKNFVGMPYLNQPGINETYFAFNFPTKLMNAACNAPRGEDYYYGFKPASPEGTDVLYSVRAMDMEENTIIGPGPIYSPIDDEEVRAFKQELNLLLPSAFDKGWYRFVFTEEQTLDEAPRYDSWGKNRDGETIVYTGAPVIPVIFNYGADGFSAMYGFWEDGKVYIDDEELEDLFMLDGYQSVRSFAFSPDQFNSF